MFQECESGFDLDSTPIVQSNPASNRAHSSNIDSNVFDKTINFSSIASNSTASLVSHTTDLSQQNDKNDTLFKSSIADQTSDSVADKTNESKVNISTYEIPNTQSNVAEIVPEAMNAENPMKLHENEVATLEEPAKIEIIVTQHVESSVEQPDSDQLDITINNTNGELITVDSVTKSFVGNVEEKLAEDQPVAEELAGNVTQDIETVTQSITETVNGLETEKQTDDSEIVNTTVNLNETTDLTSAVKEDGSPIVAPVKMVASNQQPEVKLNTTITSEVQENGVESLVNTSQAIEQSNELIKDGTPLNVTTEFSSKGVETNAIEAMPIQNGSVNIFGEMKSSEPIPTEAPVPSVTAANETFEAMDVDMDQTIEFQQPTTNQFPIEEPLLNETVEMADPDQIDEVAKPALNVTVEVPAEIVEQKSEETPKMALPFSHPEMPEFKQQMMNVTQELIEEPKNQTQFDQTIDLSNLNEPALNETVDVSVEYVDPKPSIDEVSTPVFRRPEMFDTKYQKMLNVTQDLAEESKNKMEFNQTIDLSSSKENVTSPIQENNVNDTFVQNDSLSMFDKTQNSSKDFLSSTRRTSDSTKKNPVSMSKFNLNETIVVDNRLPSINTSFIVSPKVVEKQPESKISMQTVSQPIQSQDPFKSPATPTNSSNPFDLKQKTEVFEVSDDEFSAPGRKFFLYHLFSFEHIFRNLFDFFEFDFISVSKFCFQRIISLICVVACVLEIK